MAEFPSVIELSSLNGTTGFRLDGVDVFDKSGASVASAGDVNGDGIDDLIVGAYSAEGAAGESYVMFGRDTPFASSVDLSSLNGETGFRLDGEAADRSGASVASAGDVNGDGIDDLIIGAPGGFDGIGQTYVVFGHGTPFASSLDLTSLNGTTGFRLDGIDAGDRSGVSVASAGDVNGDGFDDLIVGAFLADGLAGESYVVFGHGTPFASSLALSSLDGETGFRLDGIDAGDRSGVSVASAGDVNGDGFDDLIVGTLLANGNAGESYVVFGHGTPFASSLALSSLNGTTGFRLDGAAGDRSGRSVASAGDVNGDGFDDLIVGAYGDNDAAGRSYVVFGHGTPFASSLALSSLNGETGFRLDGIDAGDRSGRSVASAGDVNGDGFDDLIVGAFLADGLAGESYVVFGRGTPFASSIALSSLDGETGFRLDGINGGDGVVDFGDRSGRSVASAGDVNGDGFDDLIVGAYGANSFAGESYVVFGRAPDGPVNRTGSAAAQKILGGAFNDTLFGSGGEDTLEGGAGNDRLLDVGPNTLDGGTGNDRIINLNVAGGLFDGGTGNDTLDLSQTLLSNQTVNLAAASFIINGATFKGFENALGSLGDDRILGSAAKNVIAGLDGGDTIAGGAEGDRLLGGKGSDILTDAGDNTVDGGLGNDRIVNQLVQDGVWSGGRGLDTLDVRATTLQGQSFNLAAASFEIAGATFKGFEHVLGSRGGDDLIGSRLANLLSGQGGNDTVAGGDGRDTLTGGAGNDVLLDSGNNVVTGGAGNDRLVNLFVRGGTWDGGQGEDTLDVRGVSLFGQTFDLSATSFRISGATFKGFEHVTGSQGADNIIGSAKANRLDGQGGADTLAGGRGSDTLIGGEGGDTFVFAKQSGRDLVTLFQNNLDQIDLTAFNYASAGVALSHFTLVEEIGVGTTVVFSDGSTTFTLQNIKNLALIDGSDLLI